MRTAQEWDLQGVQAQVHLLPLKAAWRNANRSASQILTAILLTIVMMGPCAPHIAQWYHIAPLRNAPGMTTNCHLCMEYLTSTLK